MEEELLDVVSREDVPTGQVKAKSLVHNDGDWHRIAHVWLVTPDGYVICQKRADTKKDLPGVWDVIHGGHVKAGGNYLQTAVDELREEIGLDVDKKSLVDIGKFRSDNIVGRSVLRDVAQAFLLVHKWDLKDFKIDPKEVSEIRSFRIEELKNLVHGKDTRKMFLPGLIKTYFDEGIAKVQQAMRL